MKAYAFTRILCPVNFSDSSSRTVSDAAMLATLYDAELRLFHVGSVVTDAGEEAESIIASLLALTRKLPERLRVSAAVAYGDDPCHEIVQHARLMSSDLIVLGSDLRSTPPEFLQTVPALIMTDAPCPVLIVRSALAQSLTVGSHGFAEILCCGDFLPGSTERVDYALALGDRVHGRVTLLEVLSDGDDPAELEQQEHEPANIVDERMHVVHVALTGSPGPEIVALAKRIQSDLIVVGAQRYMSAAARLGSTTAFVMAHAPCPVLIVPSFSKAFQIQSNGTHAESRSDSY
jgi:nucleotide-binding universal stress UspA family protein